MTTKTCPVSGQTFEITAEDKTFLAKMNLPEPTLSPLERQRRRVGWRNERALYNRKCDATGKSIVSTYHDDHPFPVYDQNHFWGDGWSALDYGVDFDFSRPFFDQFQELFNKVPRISIINKQSLNSDYCNYSQKNKNCYLTFGAHFNEDLAYVNYATKANTCQDGFWLRQCELCYEGIDLSGCYNLRYGQNCHNCSDSWFMKNCIGCKNCFGGVNLRNKEYYFLNQPCTKEEYEAKLAKFDLSSRSSLRKLWEQFVGFAETQPHKFMIEKQTENVSGDYLENCKDCFECYEMSNCEDCSRSFICDETNSSLDVSHMGYDFSELCYELVGCSATFDCAFSESCWHNRNIYYSSLCFHSQDLFGCIGLKHQKYCILNKKYTPEEYETLKLKIIEHMKKTGEWGEFFPLENSPFGYNESIAQSFYPLTEIEVKSKNWKWHTTTEKLNNRSSDQLVPDNISEVSDDILNQTLHCKITGRGYRIQPSDLKFYRQMNLPVPDLHPDERHRQRVSLRNPRQLYKRKCHKCQTHIQTTYHPDRKEAVLCEDCYLTVVV